MFLSSVLVLFSLFSVSGQQDLAPSKARAFQDRYNACLDLVETAPDKALTEAFAFKADQGGVPARHCEALSLAALGEYGEAAARLKLLAEAVENSKGLPRTQGKALAASPSLAADMWHQTANAWLLADEISRAEEAIDRALALVRQGSTRENHFRIVRARIAAAGEDYQTAYREISLAIAADPQRHRLQLFLASAARQTGRLDEASSALDIYLKSFAEDPVGWLELGNLREAQKQRDAARDAFFKVLNLTSDQGDLAENARLGLQRLAFGSK